MGWFRRHLGDEIRWAEGRGEESGMAPEGLAQATSSEWRTVGEEGT